MKTTGIIRRIDSLGRVVIPKEMRKTLRIIDNDMLEITIEKESIILKKISTFENSMSYFEDLLKLINKIYDCEVFITDSSIIYSYAGKKKDVYIGNNISEYMIDCLKNRKTIEKNANSTLQITEDKNKIYTNCNYLLIPIISSGDVYGLLGFIGYKNIDNMANIGKIIAKILELKISEI